MGFLRKVWSKAKGVIIAVAVGAAIGFAVGGPLGALIGAGIGLGGLVVLSWLVTWLYMGWVSLVNGSGKPLSACTKAIMRTVGFSHEVLDKARLHEKAGNIVMTTTIGVTIYWKGRYSECGSDENITRMAHELVHVKQYIETNDVLFSLSYGLQAGCSLDHDSISYEEEAITFVDEHRSEILAARDRECAMSLSFAPALGDWAWVLHSY